MASTDSDSDIEIVEEIIKPKLITLVALDENGQRAEYRVSAKTLQKLKMRSKVKPQQLQSNTNEAKKAKIEPPAEQEVKEKEDKPDSDKTPDESN